MSVSVDMKFIAKMQQEDDRLKGIKEQFPERFQVEKIDKETQLLMYRVKKDSDCFLIYVPLAIADDLIAWFHENLMHPGDSILIETVRQMSM